MPAFSGFGPDLFAFLKGLKANNTKSWFDAHRETYETQVKALLGDLVEDLANTFTKDRIALRGDRKTSLFRLNRDVRFSKDKSPYKTAATAVMTASGTKHDPGMFYMHFEPNASFLAAGFYMPEPPVLNALRMAVVKDIKAFQKIVADLKKMGLDIERELTLTRPPKAFAKTTDLAVLELVKLTSYVVSVKLSNNDVLSADLPKRAWKFAKETEALREFGRKALK